jgi:hypothetical protein
MPNYCLLMTCSQAPKNNGNGDIEKTGDNKPYWVKSDDGTNPGDPLDKNKPPLFQAGDSVSFGFRILDATGNLVPSLASDMAVVAIISAKSGQPNAPKNSSPYRIGSSPKMFLLGSRSGGGGVPTLVAFDKNGLAGSWSSDRYQWVGFDYQYCVLSHASDTTSKFELTVACEFAGSSQWAFDPEMDVRKGG